MFHARGLAGLLNSHHQRTLNQILQHPVSHNIEWPACVVPLLEAVGSVKESHYGKSRGDARISNRDH